MSMCVWQPTLGNVRLYHLGRLFIIMNGSNWRDFVDSVYGISTYETAIEEEVEADSFTNHEDLEPSFWKNMELDPHLQDRMIKIANFFMKNLPVEAEIKDIRLTGSLANYNWSNYSDVDLHIVVDFLDVDENLDLVKAYFDNARMRWNSNHQMRLKGYDVEVYVENADEKHLSSGVYSVLNGEWIKKPERYQKNIDFSAARQKAEDIEFQVNIVGNLLTARKFKTARKNIDRLKAKIKNMRRAGLESRRREFSIENIAFKILRRNGTIESLNDYKTRLYDTIFSIPEE